MCHLLAQPPRRLRHSQPGWRRCCSLWLTVRVADDCARLRPIGAVGKTGQTTTSAIHSLYNRVVHQVQGSPTRSDEQARGSGTMYGQWL